MKIRDLKVGDHALVEIEITRIDASDGLYYRLMADDAHSIYVANDLSGKAEIHSLVEKPIGVGDTVRIKDNGLHNYRITAITPKNGWVVEYKDRSNETYESVIAERLFSRYERVSSK